MEPLSLLDIIDFMEIPVTCGSNDMALPIVVRVVSHDIYYIGNVFERSLLSHSLMMGSIGVVVQLPAGIQEDHMGLFGIGVDECRHIEEGRREGLNRDGRNLSS